MKRKLITQRYLKSGFLFDLLASLPFSIVIERIGKHYTNIWKWLKYVELLRVFRMS